MSGSISHEIDKTSTRPEYAIRSQFVNYIAYILDYFDILSFAIASNVISFPDAAAFDYGADG